MLANIFHQPTRPIACPKLFIINKGHNNRNQSKAMVTTLKDKKLKTVIYLLESDKSTLKQKAAESGVSLSTYIASICRKHLRRATEIDI